MLLRYLQSPSLWKFQSFKNASMAVSFEIYAASERQASQKKLGSAQNLTVDISFEQLAFWPQISPVWKERVTAQQAFNGLVLDN